MRFAKLGDDIVDARELPDGLHTTSRSASGRYTCPSCGDPVAWVGSKKIFRHWKSAKTNPSCAHRTMNEIAELESLGMDYSREELSVKAHEQPVTDSRKCITSEAVVTIYKTIKYIESFEDSRLRGFLISTLRGLLDEIS